MKPKPWLRALNAGPPRRPIRRRNSTAKLFVEDLEARTVPTFLPPVDYPVGSYPIAVVSGLFNNDSIPDLAVINSNSATVSVLLGNGDGTFQSARNSSTGYTPSSVAVGDFDGDNKLDLVTTNASGVSVLLGNGDGTFQPPSHIDIGSSPASVAVGDFDGDGHLDLGVASNTFVVDYYGYYGNYGHWEGQANVLLGNGHGSFAAPATTQLGEGYLRGAAAADFNDDGKDDFAVADSSPGVRVLLADPNGSGNLQASASYPTGWYPQSVAVADINGDGIDDLVTGNSGSVSVLLGNGTGGVGDGTFQTARNTPVGNSSPTSLAVGDFNHDGKMDLGVGSNRFVVDYYGYYTNYGHYERQVDVLLGHGNAFFALPSFFDPPLTTDLGEGSLTGVASADFNNDGYSDLVVTNVNTNTLSALVNDQSWPPLPPPAVSVGDATVTEGNTGSTTATFTVSLQFAHTADLTVHYATADYTATAGKDYTATSGDVTIPAGQTSATFTVPVLGDRLAEPDEYFFVNLTSSEAPILDGQGFGTILDDEPTVSISDAPGVTEGNTGSTNATFTVSLAAAYDQDVTVHYATADYTATAGKDYTATSGDVTIRAGDTTATFTVPVLGDRLPEYDETFLVNLSGATNAHIGNGQATGTILDDEPRASVGDASVVEGNTGTKALTFTITLSSASDAPVTVSYATVPGSATNAKDYQPTSGTVTFAPGQTTKTVNVPVKGDRLPESDESFSLHLTGTTGALIDGGWASGTILDDEPRISINNASVTEGNTGTKLMTFTVTLSAAYDQTVTVKFDTRDSTAGNKDYKRTSGTLRFSPGETTKTFTVEIKGDTIKETDETFSVLLSRPSSNALIEQAYGSGTILDDD